MTVATSSEERFSRYEDAIVRRIHELSTFKSELLTQLRVHASSSLLHGESELATLVRAATSEICKSLRDVIAFIERY